MPGSDGKDPVFEWIVQNESFHAEMFESVAKITNVIQKLKQGIKDKKYPSSLNSHIKKLEKQLKPYQELCTNVFEDLKGLDSRDEQVQAILEGTRADQFTTNLYWELQAARGYNDILDTTKYLDGVMNSKAGKALFDAEDGQAMRDFKRRVIYKPVQQIGKYDLLVKDMQEDTEIQASSLKQDVDNVQKTLKKQGTKINEYMDRKRTIRSSSVSLSHFKKKMDRYAEEDFSFENPSSSFGMR